MRRNAVVGALYMIGTALMFASAFVATKYTVGVVPPRLAAALRFALAGLALHGLLAVRGYGAPVQRRDWSGLAFLGVTGIFAYHALFFWALQFTTASLSALLVPTTIPIATVLLARLLHKELLGTRRLLGIALACAGALLAVGQRGAVVVVNGLRGELALLVAVACFSFYTVFGQALVARYGAIRTTAHATTIGTALLAVIAWPEWYLVYQIPKTAWLVIAFMGVGSSAAGLVWYYRGGELLGAAKAAVFLYLVPLFTVVLSVLLLNENVSLWQLLGGAIIVLGVIVVQSVGRVEHIKQISAQIEHRSAGDL